MQWVDAQPIALAGDRKDEDLPNAIDVRAGQKWGIRFSLRSFVEPKWKTVVHRHAQIRRFGSER